MSTVTSSQKITQRVSIEEFVNGLRKLPESDFTGVQGTLEYLRTNPVDADSLEPYLFWDAQHYTRNLVDKTELYEFWPSAGRSGTAARFIITKDRIAGWPRRWGAWPYRTIAS